MKQLLIVGGGFSGTTLCHHLHALNRREMAVTIVDRSHQIDKQGASLGSLLQVPAAHMSITDDNPDDFVHWLDNNKRQLRGISSVKMLREQYIPKQHYKRYLASIRDRLCLSPNAGFVLDNIYDEVIDILEPTADKPCTVVLKQGKTLHPDHCVLAIGDPFPQPLTVQGLPPNTDTYIEHTVNSQAIRFVHTTSHVTIVGSGIGMLDCLISLIINGHSGPITILSQHTIIQRPSVSQWFKPNLANDKVIDTIFNVIASHSNIKEDPSWQYIMTTVKPQIIAFWRDLSPLEKKRFYRYIKAYWSAQRRRIAPHVSDLLNVFLNRNAFNVVTASIRTIRYEQGNYHILLHKHAEQASTQQEITCDVIINCSTTHGSNEQINNSLIQNLLRRGTLQVDRLGIICNLANKVINAQRQPLSWLSALGPTTHGGLFEVITVPELRRQCQVLSEQICHS